MKTHSSSPLIKKLIAKECNKNIGKMESANHTSPCPPSHLDEQSQDGGHLRSLLRVDSHSRAPHPGAARSASGRAGHSCPTVTHIRATRPPVLSKACLSVSVFLGCWLFFVAVN